MVREFIIAVGLENLGQKLVLPRSPPPAIDHPKIDLASLISYGNSLELEQENVKRVQLSDSYLKGSVLAGITRDER